MSTPKPFTLRIPDARSRTCANGSHARAFLTSRRLRHGPRDERRISEIAHRLLAE